MVQKPKNLVLFLCLTLLLSACNLPGLNQNPTPILFPTPNYTMTALFSVDEQSPTATPPVIVVTQTEPTQEPSASPTATLPPPTQTPFVVTATPQATSTSTSTPTATGTSVVRYGNWVTASYLATAPNLDSVWDEWSTTKYPAKYVAWGSGEWEDSDDLEGSFRVGWDANYLYLAVKVLDDQYVQNATGQDIYKGDSIEILFDSNLYGDLNSTNLSSDDYQIGISPGKGGTDGNKEGYLWFPASKAGGISGLKIASSQGDGVYRVEMAIPWSVFGISPASGQQYGFGLSISDNDKESSNVQQSMVSNLSNRSLVNPTTWTVLTLTK
jgi:hypothetical protein